MNDEWEVMGKESVMIIFKALSQYSSAVSEENHVKHWTTAGFLVRAPPR
jgi:hypothetical protein